MQLITVVAITSLAASVSAFTPANPFVKHLAARVVYVDGSYGNMAKRQTSCPAGYTACGSGCAAGPCCDAANGLACRPNETCATVNGQLSCCPVGYTCDAVRSCQNAIGGCVPGSINNGVMCCDATAPLCLTSSNTPYCAGVAPSTTYTVPAQTAGASSGASSGAGSSSSESTSTLSLTSTATQTITMESTSNAITSLPAETGSSGTSGSASTSGSTETVVILPTGYSTAVLTVVSGSSTYTTTATLSPTSYTQITVSSIESSASSSASGSSGPTASGSSGATASGSVTSTSVVTATAKSTSTFTAVVSVYPTANTTYGNATATIIAPTQATGAASRFSVSAGCALAAVMGLFYLL